MRITLVTPRSQNVEPYIPMFRSKGVIVHHNQIHPACEAIIGTGQVGIQLVQMFHKMMPDIPLINLTLDFYKTVWTAPNPHGYDWKLYRDILRQCDELWCVSNEVILRMDEEGVDIDKCKLMKIWARFFEYEGEVKDNRYILNPMRPYPADKNYGWLSKVCEELSIPLVSPKHKLSEEEFQKTIAECSFLCCELHEASTGGLTLLEGLNLGKPSVISDSKYMGASDYLGDFATYFDDTSYENFKQTIRKTWENTPSLDLEQCKKFCNSHPTIEDNVDFMIERIKVLKKERNT